MSQQSKSTTQEDILRLLQHKLSTFYKCFTSLTKWLFASVSTHVLNDIRIVFERQELLQALILKNVDDEARAIKAYRKKQQKQLANEAAAREAVQAHHQKCAAMRLEQQRKRDKSVFKTKPPTKAIRISALVHLGAGSSSDAADQCMSPSVEEAPKHSANTVDSADPDGSRAWIRVGRGRWREASLLEAEHVPDHVSFWDNEQPPTPTELLTHDGRWQEFLRQEASRQSSDANVSHPPLPAAATWCLEELE